MPATDTDDLLRGLAPQVLGAVVRRYGHFDLAEDAVQEALLAAATQWPRGGRPDQPKNWLIAVAGRRLTDLLRADQARRKREEVAASRALPDDWLTPAADHSGAPADDSLILLFLCCHPSLSPASQIALTLRAVGGLTTAEIARAFLTNEATITRRISRAKRSIKDSGLPFRLPPPEDREPRLAAVRQVLYLIFNEGYVATSGEQLARADLSREAIRLARLLHQLLPDDGEVAGLLALMLLTDARRPARTNAAGELVLLAEQDRHRWNGDDIVQGISLITATLPRGVPGPYQLQAAIAALHDEAATAEETDWPQITALYERLLEISDNPVIALNHAVAVTMAHGPAAGLPLLDRLGSDERLVHDHRLYAVRGHLLEMVGDLDGARRYYLSAAEQTLSLPQQRYLRSRAARLASGRRVQAMGDAETDRVNERSDLLPEELVAGSDDPRAQAEAILADSDRRTDQPEQTRDESTQTPG